MKTISRTEWLHLSDNGKNQTVIKCKFEPYCFVSEIDGVQFNVLKQTVSEYEDQLSKEYTVRAVNQDLVKFGHKPVSSYNELLNLPVLTIENACN